MIHKLGAQISQQIVSGFESIMMKYQCSFDILCLIYKTKESSLNFDFSQNSHPDLSNDIISRSQFLLQFLPHNLIAFISDLKEPKPSNLTHVKKVTFNSKDFIDIYCVI